MLPGPEIPSRLPPLAVAAAGGIAFAYLVQLGLLLAGHHWIVDARGHPLALDFLSFWSAGHLALTGHASTAYDWPAMHLLQQQLMGRAPDGYLGWAYPPLFFCVAIPLALIPYAASFVIWVCAGLALYAVAIACVARARGAALLACAVPAALGCVMPGQNGFLSAALIAGALLQLETRPLIAGLLLGLLTYKPHLGLLFPIALIFGGYWRAFFSAAVTTITILFLSWLLAADSLAAFVAHLGNMSDNFLTGGTAGFFRQQSLYGLLRMSGVGDHAAFVAQGALLAAMAIFVAWLWRGERPLALKCAGLCVAALLATPYLYFYDLPILSVAIAFLWRERPFSRREAILLIASQLVMASFIFVNAPMGFGGALLVLAAVMDRIIAVPVKGAPQPRTA
jgi:arabinofuranan 3-O-arabinosyltransferase